MNTAESLVSDTLRLWTPPPRLSLSKWADTYFHLSSEYSAKQGKWTTLPYQREPLDSISDPLVKRTVIKAGRQMLKSLAIMTAVGYFSHQDPCPILVVQPGQEDAESFSKERIAPMIRDNPVLTGLYAEAKGRNSANTVGQKQFPGGGLSIVGAGSPRTVARRTIRILCLDEIDKYKPTSEGNVISLGRHCLTTFRHRAKEIDTCTPTVQGSNIDRAYEESDQRELYLPCPYCGHSQSLIEKFHKQVRFDASPALSREQQAATARYHCESPTCGAAWTDADRMAAVEHGVWRANKPFNGIAGFWISQLYSPWKQLSEIVLEFLTKKDDALELQTFVNCALAENWQDRGEAPDDEMLYLRREGYEIGTVPRRGLFLTAFVDVQDEALHFELKAWGRNKENWSVAYHVIECETDHGHKIKTSSPEPWIELAKLIERDWPHESGEAMPIMAMGIDSGFRPQTVYDFALNYAQPHHSDATGSRIYAPRTVVVTKGASHETGRLIAGVSTTDSARKRQGIKIWSVGTGVAKQEFYDSLRKAPPEDGSFPAGYCHYPYPEREFYRQICSESRIVNSHGKAEWVRDPSRRNEPVDTHVGNRFLAGLCGIDGLLSEEDWRGLEEFYHVEATEPVMPIPQRAVEPKQERQEQRRNDGGGWFSSERKWF